ncbi:uncharacterized protein LOC110271980 [Arachis ipaensis]|uniref:uncharacterized protein LOC110271980 n=1 Tax=Arachis ipaensis TaxID=130454 RepID=UPI000A2B86A2|nr:uncharacterized protein LOC110271980 [Arachis ipaensis]
MAHIAFPNTHEEGRNRPVRERAAPPVALEGSERPRGRRRAKRELAVKREGRYLVRHCHTCIPPLLPRARYRRSWIVVLASCEEKRGETPSVSAASVCCERSWRRRSFHCRQKLPPSSQLLQWSSPVVNGCRRSGCGCRNHTGASGRFRRLRPCCCHRKILPLIHQSFWPPPELCRGRSETVAASCCYSELFMLLQKCVGLCFEAAFDFKLR